MERYGITLDVPIIDPSDDDQKENRKIQRNPLETSSEKRNERVQSEEKICTPERLFRAFDAETW